MKYTSFLFFEFAAIAIIFTVKIHISVQYFMSCYINYVL